MSDPCQNCDWTLSCYTKPEDCRKPETRSSLAAMSGSRFRLIDDGETVRENAERLSDDAETWVPVGHDGFEFQKGFHVPMRIPISPENASVLPSEE